MKSHVQCRTGLFDLVRTSVVHRSAPRTGRETKDDDDDFLCKGRSSKLKGALLATTVIATRRHLTVVELFLDIG